MSNDLLHEIGHGQGTLLREGIASCGALLYRELRPSAAALCAWRATTTGAALTLATLCSASLLRNSGCRWGRRWRGGWCRR